MEIPYESLTEYVVNALVHRSLNIKAPIRIFIFDDRVEIHSPGSLPNGLTIEDIKNGTSMPRNMFLFTNANYLLPYTGAGSDVRRALEYDPDVIFSNGINDKEITHSANEFVITIPRKAEQVHDQPHSNTDPTASKSEQPTDQTVQNTTQLAHETDPANDQAIPNTTNLSKNTDQVTDQPSPKTDQPRIEIDSNSDQPHSKTDQVPHRVKLSKKQLDIKNFCSIPRTTKEILERAGVTNHFYNRKNYIYDLVEAGVLERTIPDKPNDPNQKYRRKQ